MGGRVRRHRREGRGAGHRRRPDASRHRDRIREAVSFVPSEDTVDRNGHGTHVASTIAGSGAASGGANKGVAPGADLLVGKVLDEFGQGQDSWVIDGMEWASQAQDADVVNMSLGDPTPSDGTDPISQALNQLTEETGALFVVAAGNNYVEFSLGSPGVADAALTVAAVDGLDQRAVFSSMGPRVGDHALKPDISAPGVDVLAARSQAIPWGEGMYQPMDGTSMATPHVAGAAAILAARRPGWGARRLKDALMSSSKALPGTTPYEVGTGRLDIPASLGEVHATGSAFLGFFSWPHDGDAPVTKTITYTNAGDMPVTLSLRDEITGPDGQELPELVALSGEEVTVPAGGSAEVTVAADADDAAGVGRYTGFVVATDASGAVRARTAVGLVKEEERYTLKIRAIGRDGEPAGGYVTFYEYGTEFVETLPIDPETGRVAPRRLKPGIYDVTSWLPVSGVGGPDSAGVALLGDPHLVVDRDKELVLDARKAKRVTVKTPRPSEDRYRRVQYHHNTGIGGIFEAFTNTQIVQPDVDDIFVAPTGVVPGKAFDFAVRWRRSEPLLDLSAHLPRRTALDPIYQGGSVRLDGKVFLRGVYAGTGTAAEYEGVNAQGRAVLISRSDAVQPWDWAPVAAEAGAALLVVVNDRPGKLYEFAGGGGTDLPVVSLTKAQGDPLIAAARAGRLVLHGDAVEFPEYMYDLARSDARGFPAGLAYSPRTGELARIDQRFIGGTPRLAFEGRYDCRPYQWPLCLGSYEPVQTGSTRADYVSTQAGTKWYQDVFHADGWEQRHDQVTYKAGRRTSFDWFAPVTRPRLGPGYWGPDRSDDFMSVNVPTCQWKQQRHRIDVRACGHRDVTPLPRRRPARRAAVPGRLRNRADQCSGAVSIRAGHRAGVRPMEDVDPDPLGLDVHLGEAGGGHRRPAAAPPARLRRRHRSRGRRGGRGEGRDRHLGRARRRRRRRRPRPGRHARAVLRRRRHLAARVARASPRRRLECRRAVPASRQRLRLAEGHGLGRRGQQGGAGDHPGLRPGLRGEGRGPVRPPGRTGLRPLITRRARADRRGSA